MDIEIQSLDRMSWWHVKISYLFPPRLLLSFFPLTFFFFPSTKGIFCVYARRNLTLFTAEALQQAFYAAKRDFISCQGLNKQLQQGFFSHFFWPARLSLCGRDSFCMFISWAPGDPACWAGANEINMQKLARPHKESRAGQKKWELKPCCIPC